MPDLPTDPVLRTDIAFYSPRSAHEQEHAITVANALLGTIEAYHAEHPSVSYRVYMAAAAYVIQALSDEAGSP